MFITNDIELAAAVEHMRAAGTDLAEYELKTVVLVHHQRLILFVETHTHQSAVV